MTQTRRDSKLKKELGERLLTLVEAHLQLTWDELAMRLGYANSSTLRQVRNGQTLLSLEKLVRLAYLEAPDGSRVSVNWLLTGEGTPLLVSAPQQCLRTLVRRLAKADPEVQRKIEMFLEVQGV